MAKTLLTTLLSLFFIAKLSSAEYLSLEGQEWIAINSNKTIAVNARVPGSIYSDLRREKLYLKENIYFGYNDVNYRWVSYDNWTYERLFEVDAKLLSRESVHLVANGIDTVSSVYINDQLIGNTDNMFVRYKFDVKQILKSGINKIKIAFKSAPIFAKTQSDIHMKTYGYPIPPECPGDVQHGECHSNYIRKMQSSFSWDWGPAFPTQGIWKSIGIESYNSAIIRDILVETTPDKQNSSHWTLKVTLNLETAALKKMNSSLTIKLNENALIDNQNQLISPKNDKTVKLTFVIPINKIPITPWFPNGVADNTQTLYDLKVSLSVPDSKEVSTKSVRIGFRQIELIQDPVEPAGLTFYFKVNGKQFFAKGSNWIPANVLTEDISREYLRHLLESAKEANMNMLRVWGGGIYESGYFYELADELGIMLWHDFMFACALYPTDPNFLRSVDAEITTQVRRLQHHPSIAIWAGNNENEIILPGMKTNATIYKNDYRELYINHIRRIVLEEDNSRPFVSSSPSNGLESQKENWTASNPNDNRYGDVHHYDYGSSLWDWKVYPSTRFTSEYGFESFPSLETLSEVLSANDLTYPISATLDHHEHHPDGEGEMEKMSARYFKLPSNGGAERLDDLIYLLQVTQAMAMKTETEFYRRNRAINSKTGEGYTMGALYWQLNDIWQGPTWASIEFGGKWKLLHSFARNFFKNQLISPYEDTNETLKVAFVRDDYLGVLPFNLSVQVFKWSSLKPVLEIKSQIKTDSFSSNIVYSHSIPDLLNQSKCVDRSECLLLVEIENSEHKLWAHNFMLLSEPKNSKIAKPNIKLIDVKQRPKDLDTDKFVYEIELSSEAVTPFVLMDFKLGSKIKGHFPHNGFFMFVSPKTIEFLAKHDIPVEEIKENLTFKTVTDVISKIV